MITEIAHVNMPGNLRLSNFMGLSTDDPKPTDGVCNGSTFYEMDTGDTYYYDATDSTGGWVKPTPAETAETTPEDTVEEG